VSIDVEVNLKIPALTERLAGGDKRKINNRSVRFTKRITVEAIPKPSESLQLSTQGGLQFDCRVARSDWSEEQSLFVVSCVYAHRSITAEEYHALVTDTGWTRKELPF
jgi:hypothetical protein